MIKFPFYHAICSCYCSAYSMLYYFVLSLSRQIGPKIYYIKSMPNFPKLTMILIETRIRIFFF